MTGNQWFQCNGEEYRKKLWKYEEPWDEDIDLEHRFGGNQRAKVRV